MVRLRGIAAVTVGLAVLLPALAQVGPDEPPKARPAPTPTQKELDAREAKALYGVGRLHEKNHRLVQALTTFEKARKLDPTSPDILKALIPLYLAVERVDDALEACRAALALDPQDHDTLTVYGRQLRERGKAKEALEMLGRAAAAPGLKGQPNQRAQLLYEIGGLCKEGKDWAGAERAYRELAVLLEAPDDLVGGGDFTKDEILRHAADNRERLAGLALDHLVQPDQAVLELKKALELDPTRSARLTFHLAKVGLKRDRPDEALAHVTTHLRTKPRSPEAYELLALTLRRLKRHGDIVPSLDALLRDDGDNAALKLVLAAECRRADQAPRAEALYTGLLQERPTADAYKGLFELYKADPRGGAEKILTRLNKALDAAVGKDEDKEGDAAEAAHGRAMLAALRDDKDAVKQILLVARRHLADATPLAYPTRVSLAVLAARTGQLGDAEEMYRHALTAARPVRRGNEHEVYSGLLSVLRQARKHDDVLKVCAQGLEHARNTNRVLFHRNAADAYAALGRLPEALKAADDAVAEAGDDDRLLCRRGRVEILLQAGKPDDAVAEGRALLKEYNHGKDARAVRTTLAHAYAAAGKFDESDRQLRWLIADDPTDPTPYNDLGYHLAERGKDLAEAERLVRKAIALDRAGRDAGTGLRLDADADNAAYVDSLGWVLFKQGKFAEARAELEKAVQLVGGADDPVLRDHLGDIYFRLGEKAKAREEWAKALGFFDAGHRRKSDARYKDIQHKLRLVEP